MSNVKRFLFENRNFDPDYDPDADHSYDYEGEEGVLQDQRPAEEDIEDEDEEEEELPPPPTFSEEEVLAAQQTAFDEGKQAGLEEAMEQFEHMMSTALTQIAQTIPQVFDAHSTAQETHEAHALSVATAISKKIIPSYAEKNGLDEIVSVVARCLEPLRSEPRLIIKVNESLREAINDKLVQLADEMGFDGRVVVMAHEDLIPGDCRVEWSEGGADRKTADLWKQIDEILQRNLTQEGDQGEYQTMMDEAEASPQSETADGNQTDAAG
jgi:flagellar assembly protein FliH